MGNVNAIVKKQFQQFKGIFDIDDKVVIEPIVSEYDVHLSCPVKPETTIPKGQYKGFRIKSKNGNVYTENCFRNAIGYVLLKDIFRKDGEQDN